MTRLQTRAAELQSAGRVPLYCYKQATVTPDKADNVQIALGLQPNGRYLNLADLDSHTAEQDAIAARAAFALALPHVASKIEWHDTPRGLHGFFETCKKLPTGRLYDASGNHIGELLGDGSHTRDHGDIAPRTLSLTEIDHMFLHWSVDCGEDGGAQWKERAKEGAKLTAGYTRTRVTRQQLRDFLQKECGGVGTTLNALFDERGTFDRSAAAGNLMQTLMYHARRMPGGESYRTVMAYWMAAGSYGKATDRDYNQEKDGCSLIAQIVHGDMKKNGKPWIAPFWVKGRASVPLVQIAEPAPRKPAHRPVGDQEKQIARLKRLLERRAFDSYDDRLYYNTDDLAEYLGVTRRSVQNYLSALACGDCPQIERGQDGGRGGRAWLILTPAFWGANNSESTAEKSEKSADSRGENESAMERIATPQTADQPRNAKEDHQNPFAPAPSPPAAQSGESAGAVYMPSCDWTNGGRLDLSGWRDPREMRVPPEPIDRTPPPRRFRRQLRQKGQESFMGRDGIAATFKRKKRHGEAPAPTPYRPRAALVTEQLPEPPAAAPAGAHSFGDPLPGPQAGPTPAQRMAERQRREAQQAFI